MVYGTERGLKLLLFYKETDMNELTPIEILELPNLYKNALIRHGLEYVEDVENFLETSDVPLSQVIRHLGVKGDFAVADAISFYREGVHLERNVNMTSLTVKDPVEIELIKGFRRLDKENQRKAMEFVRKFL